MRAIPSMCHAPVCLTYLRLSTLHSSQSLPSSTSSSGSFTSSSMWIGSERNPLCASANEESGPLVNDAPLTQSRDCPRIENEEEDEEEEHGQKEDQVEVQWAEDEKLEEVLDRRRMEGNSLQAEVTQKVAELVVHEHMSQRKKRSVREKRN